MGDLFEILMELASLGYSVDPVYPSSGLTQAYKAGLLKFDEALDIYLCMVPVTRKVA